MSLQMTPEWLAEASLQLEDDDEYTALSPDDVIMSRAKGDISKGPVTFAFEHLLRTPEGYPIDGLGDALGNRIGTVHDWNRLRVQPMDILEMTWNPSVW